MNSIRDILIAILEFFYHLTGSYGAAIFLLLLVVKAVLFPLTFISQRTMLKTQKIQPEINEIRAKYKNDMQMQQKKLEELYAEHNLSMFSPLMSIVPIFLSWPVIIALFTLLRNYFNDIGASFLWVSDISETHHLEFAIIVFVAQVLSMYISSKLMSSNQPKSMFVVSIGLSLFVGYLAYTYPVALGIFWASFSLLGILEQVLIKKVLLRKHVEEINIKTNNAKKVVEGNKKKNKRN